MDFITADPHFWHKNIVIYESRPFKTLEEMNRTLRNKWNNVVSKKDRIFILGDFGFATFEQTAELVSGLNGWKFLIMGNHDRGHSVSWWMRAGFNQVSQYPIIYKDFYIMSHEPIYLNDHMPYVNLHGHIHGKQYEGEQHVCLSVEHTNYAPVPIERFLKKNA
jgi:calcineurin-like phosphoesterase family protein